MKYEFLNIFLEQEDLFNQAKQNINPFLLQNNREQIQKIYDFYKGSTNLLYVNGFLGTGKTDIINYSTSFLSKETIILKYDCFNSTVLDDVLLSFFSDFKSLSSQKEILEPRVKTENFTQKVNSYFSHIEKPFVIILDSFEALLEENRQEILDFIFHLISTQKVKVIITGRTFQSKLFNEVELERITTYALEREIFDKFIKAEKIKITDLLLEELYKHSRGYYFFTALSIKIMQNQNLSLFEFLTKLKESFLPLNTFLEQQSFDSIPPADRYLFWLLSIIRHPLNKSFLQKHDFYNEENFNLLLNNLIISQNEAGFYVKDYLRDYVDETTSANVLSKIRLFIIDAYKQQLPLKPLQRDFCISRQTMRKEIEYHTFFLPKKIKDIENKQVDVNYLSYSSPVPMSEQQDVEIEEKEEKTDKFQTSQQESQHMESLPSIIGRDLVVQEEKEEIVNCINDVLPLIEIAEESYKYSKVIKFCKQALLMDEDPNYQTNLSLLYTKIAYAYQNNAEYEKALEFYEKAKLSYERKQDYRKVDYIKFNIANIFYETYKIDNAKLIFNEIIHSKDSPKSLQVQAYLKLAGLEEDASNRQQAFDLYKNALVNSDEMMDVEILSELYFKYALFMDDRNDVQTAIKYYDKCINLSSSPLKNKFLSSAYSNVAGLYLEQNNPETALQNYKKAYEIDLQTDNKEGIYYSASKLASVLRTKQPLEALEYLNVTLDYAKKLNDIFYIISATLEIGDYHYDSNKNEIALKYYLEALEMAQNNLSKDNIYKIEVRINDIKMKLGAEKFDALVEIIKREINA